MRSTIAAIGAALTFSASPASALGVLAYGDEPVGDPGAVVQDLISTEFERFFSRTGHLTPSPGLSCLDFAPAPVDWMYIPSPRCFRCRPTPRSTYLMKSLAQPSRGRRLAHWC